MIEDCEAMLALTGEVVPIRRWIERNDFIPNVSRLPPTSCALSGIEAVIDDDIIIIFGVLLEEGLHRHALLR